MRTEHVAYVLVILSGCWLAWRLLRSSWPGWKGLPLLWLTCQATNDLGVAPLLSDLAHVEYGPTRLVTRSYGMEVLLAGVLICLCYSTIAAGMLSVRSLGIRNLQPNVTQLSESCSLRVARRAWCASLLFFVIGTAVNVVVLIVLLRGYNLMEVLSRRALYSDASLVDSPFYYLLQILSQSMLIGALGMVFFSRGRRHRLRAGIAASFLTIGITAIYGGRQGVVSAMVCFFLIYRYGVGRIPLRRMIGYTLVFMLTLCVLVLTRFGHLFSGGLAKIGVFGSLRLLVVGYSRLDDAAWILRTVPDVMPYTGILNAAGVVGRFVPGMVIPQTDTLYGYVVQHFYGGVNPYSGTVGSNYATGAELYSWGGWPSVIVFGYMIGLFFGIIFEWQRRCSRNPFLVLLAVLVSVQIFFPGVQARMPYLLSRVGMYVVFIAVLAVLSIPNRRVVPFVLLLWWNLVPLLVWKAIDFDYLRVVILATVPVGYLLAVQSLRIAGKYCSDNTLREQFPPSISVSQP